MAEHDPQVRPLTPFLEHTEKLLFEGDEGQHLAHVDDFYDSCQYLLDLIREDDGELCDGRESTEEAKNFWIKDIAEGFVRVVQSSPEHPHDDRTATVQYAAALLVDAHKSLDRARGKLMPEPYSEKDRENNVCYLAYYIGIISTITDSQPRDDNDFYMALYVKQRFSRIFQEK